MKKYTITALCTALLCQNITVLYAQEDFVGEEKSDREELSTVNAERITTDQREIWLKFGESRQLSYALEPDGSEDTVQWKIYWMSDDVLTIDDHGVVTASYKTGTAWVQAYLPNGSSVTYDIYIAEDPKKFSFGKSSVKMGSGSSRTIYLNVNDWEAYYCRKHVVIDNPGIISLTQPEGEVGTYEEYIGNSYFDIYPMNPGTATVTVTADNGVTASLEVQVLNGIFAESITPVESKVWLKPGEQKQLEYALYPKNAEDTVEWVLSFANENCVSLSGEGLVTANNTYNDASIYAYIYNGNSAQYHVYVAKDPVIITADKTQIKIRKGFSRDIHLDTQPYEASNCRKHVISDNEDIVSVSEEWTEYSFTLHGNEVGTSTVAVTADNGVGTVIEVEVIDGDFADSITPVEDKVWLKPGDQKQLEYTLSPKNAVDEIEWEFAWSHPNGSESCIDLDQNGLISAKRAGSEAVTARIMNGNTAYYNIYVADDPSSLSFNQSTIIMPPNSSEHVSVSVLPGSAELSRKHIISNHPEIVTAENEWTGSTEFNLISNNPGKAMITIIADNGVTASIQVEVIEGIAENISTNNTDSAGEIWLKPGESKQLEYYLAPSSSNEVPVFTSDNEDAVRVDENGVITAIGSGGKAQISAKIRNGRSVSYGVYINEDAEKIQFEKNEYYVPAGVSVWLPTIIKPEQIQFSHIEYSSSDPAIASFNDNYSGYKNVLFCNQPGTAVITAKTENGISAYTSVHVVDGYAYDIQASEKRVFLELNETARLPYKLQSITGNTGKEKIAWEITSGEDIVSVDEYGIITAKDYGTAKLTGTISCRSIEDYFGSQGSTQVSFYIYVGQQPKKMYFPKDEYELNVGDRMYLYALSDSSETESVKKEYVSSDPTIVTVSGYYTNENEAVAMKPGTVTITASAENGAAASTIIHVRDGSGLCNTYSRRINDFHVILRPGETNDLKSDGNGYNLDLTDPSYRWISEDETIASVKDGVITGVNRGTVAIDLIDREGIIRAKYWAVVNSVSSMHFTQDEYYLPSNTSIVFDELLVFETQDQMADDITIKSDNEDILKIWEEEARYATTGRKGDVTITAETPDGLSADCIIHVGNKASAETLEFAEKEPLTIHSGYSIIPDIMVLPYYADPSGYILKSSDSGIVKVNNRIMPQGYMSLTARPSITGVKPGTAIITASLINNPNESISFEVMVEDSDTKDSGYSHVLYRHDDKRNIMENLGYQDEYTCYIGESYSLQGYKLEMHSIGKEYICLAAFEGTLGTLVSQEPANCIVESEDGYGAASGGPIRFYRNNVNFLFTAAHPGTATIRTIGNHNVKIKVVDPDSIVSVYGNSLALEGKIGVNYYLDIPEQEVNDTDIRIIFNNTDRLIHAKDAAVRTVSGKKLRLITVYVCAKEMRDTILLSVEDIKGNKKILLDTEGKDITETGYKYSVASYFEKAQETDNAKLKALVQATDTYGKYAQIYFNYKPETAENPEDVSSVTADTLRKYRALSAGSVEGIGYLGSSLSLDSDTSVRAYFNLEAGKNINEYEFSVNGEKAEPILKGKDQYYLTIDNIAAQDLNKAISITSEKGEEIIMIKYYPLSYGYAALTSDKTGEAIKNTCRALYLYNQAAVAYFN